MKLSQNENRNIACYHEFFNYDFFRHFLVYYLQRLQPVQLVQVDRTFVNVVVLLRLDREVDSLSHN